MAFQCRDQAREDAKPGFAGPRRRLQDLRPGLPTRLAQRRVPQLDRRSSRGSRGLPGSPFFVERRRFPRRAALVVCAPCADARSPQPAAAARRLQPVRAATARSSRPSRREGGGWAARASCSALGAHRRSARRMRVGRAGQRAPRRCCARTTATATASTRSSSIPLARADARSRRARAARAAVARRRGRARTSRAPRCSIVLEPGRGRPRLPDLDDLRGRAGAARAARARAPSGSRG